MNILLTGGDKMLGQYLRRQFSAHNVTSAPEGGPLDLALLADGDTSVLPALESAGLRWLVFVSPFEERWERLPQQRECERWTRQLGVSLTIVHPATMLGSGADGWVADLYDKVTKGRYLQVRGLDPKLSLITAYDAARFIEALYTRGGEYDISDGREHTLSALTVAMTANQGAEKRMWTLPEKWVRWILKLTAPLPSQMRPFRPDMLELLAGEQLLDPSEALASVSFSPFDAIEALARRADGFPYLDD